MGMTNLRDLALQPRAVALLVALRKGPRSTASLADAIGDTLVAQTRSLCQLMADGFDGYRLIAFGRDGLGTRAAYGLTHDGLGWLQSQGLDASESAKQALYAATDAQAVR
jgi:hypothetical protein